MGPINRDDVIKGVVMHQGAKVKHDKDVLVTPVISDFVEEYPESHELIFLVNICRK